MKSTLYLLVLLISTNCFAQVKIGNNPTVLNPSSLLELESTNKSLLISRVADTNAITAPINGMIIYDLSSKCFKGYQDGAWTDCGFVSYPKVNSVLIQIGNEADNPNVVPSVVTIAQITSLGVSCVVATSQTQYRAYIDANPNSFSSPATIAEVQAMTTALAALAPNALVCGAGTLITTGTSLSTTATGGDGGAITWAITPSTGVSTSSGTGLSTGAITFSAPGTYTLTYTATKTPPVGCGSVTTSTCSKTITVSAFTLSGTGFESAIGCLLNGSIGAFNANFSDNLYKGYIAIPPIGTVGNFQLDVQNGSSIGSDCYSSYGTAWSGSKFLGIAAGDGFTIDLGANLVPGSTFTMIMYERVAPTVTSVGVPYRVGISNAAGTSGGTGLNNLFTTTATSNATWTAKTISFTVPNVTGYRYLTIECINALGTAGWTLLDF